MLCYLLLQKQDKMRSIFFLFASFFISLSATARVEVAFLEVYGRDGKPIELEKGGRFAHVAIRFNDQWLQAHPLNGVELVDDLSGFGRVLEILVDPDIVISKAEVDRWLGLPYDPNFNWEDQGSSYCSKLVANLLSVPPQPMRFDGSYWERYRSLPWGEPGVSPNGLYEELLERGYTREL